MKRVYLALGVFLVSLILLGLLFVNISQTAGVAGVLPRLRGGEADYQYVRKKVLFMMGDPAPALYEFIGKPSTGRTARYNALRLLEELAGHQALHDGGGYIAPLLQDTSSTMRNQALRTLEAMESMSGIQPVIDLYWSATDTAVMQQCYRTLKACTTPLNRTLNQAMREHDSTRIDSCIAVIESYPVDKGRMLSNLARYFHAQGDYQRSAEMYRRMGVPSCWWAVGEFSFDDATLSGIDVPRSPETRPFTPHDTFVVADGFMSRWFPLQRNNDWGNLNLRPLFSRQDRTVAYFFTYVHVPTDRDAHLFAHTDDAGKLWLNDSLVTRTFGFKQFVTNEDVFPVTLHAGVNTLMAKVANGRWGWSLFVRVADSTGEAMDDVSFSLSPSPAHFLIDTIVARAANDNPGWRAILDSVNVEDRHAIDRLVNVIVDRGEPAARRQAALGVLIETNSRRQVPAGESELIRLGLDLARSGKGSSLLNAVAHALADMRTTRALDLGLALRAIPDRGSRLQANRLLSVYARTRIHELGDLGDQENLPRNARAVSEIVSLEAPSPWVQHRLASFRLGTGDTAAAQRFVAPYRMPRRWVVRPTSCASADMESSSCASPPGGPIDSC
ncbi:MAG: hypothetical protein GF331_19225, partial [Chitinivibrionales bacterium]|nr:hypothetical protein [Chitinivibrionales bacterium]